MHPRRSPLILLMLGTCLLVPVAIGRPVTPYKAILATQLSQGQPRPVLGVTLDITWLDPGKRMWQIVPL